MATEQDDAGTNNAVDQVTQTLKSVTDALKTAGEKAVEGNRELTQCVMKQAEQNMKQLLQTLQAAAGTRNPTEAANLYTRFLTESAQAHTQQLMEVGQIVAQSSRQSWAPVAEAIMSASKRSDLKG